MRESIKRDSVSLYADQRDYLVSCTQVYETSAGDLRSICLLHLGLRDKRRVSKTQLCHLIIP